MFGKILIDWSSRNKGNATALIKKALEKFPADKKGIIGLVDKFQDKEVMNHIFEKLGAKKASDWNWLLNK